MKSDHVTPQLDTFCFIQCENKSSRGLLGLFRTPITPPSHAPPATRPYLRARDVSSPGDLEVSALTHLNPWLRWPLPGEAFPGLLALNSAARGPLPAPVLPPLFSVLSSKALLWASSMFLLLFICGHSVGGKFHKSEDFW